MASSSKGLSLLKTLELIKKRPVFDATAVLTKMKLQSASNGVLKGSFIIEKSMCNLGRTLHGGYIASVVDVFSFYSQLCTPDGKLSWTKTMNIIYLGSAKEGETVNVETKPLRSGNASIVETFIHSCEGHLLAKGITTFNAGHEKHQLMFKDECNFDVYKNSDG